jgi:hypothetical protein
MRAQTHGLIRYSKTLGTHVPTENKARWAHFERNAERDALGVRRTSLVYVKQSMFLLHPAPLINELGEIELRDSVVGDGLYAARRLPKHTVIGEYRGRIIEDEEDARGDSSYRFLVENIRTHKYLFTIDGEDAGGSSIVRYANAVDSVAQQNAAFVQFPPPGTRAKGRYGHRIVLVALRDLARDEEIVAWYGEDTARIIDAPPPKPSGLCNIDRIVEMRRARKGTEFRVRWDGYGAEDDTWEPASGIPPGVIREYEAERAERAGRAGRAERASAFGSHGHSRRRFARATGRTSSRASTYVARSKIDGCTGDGLFASRSIPKDARVVAMISPIETTRPGLDMPDDSIVYLSRNGMHTGVRDYNWTNATRKPHWYYLNHADSGNTMPVYDALERQFYWITRRVVAKGEELTFNYNPGHRVYFD